jgi:hypothetical protein
MSGLGRKFAPDDRDIPITRSGGMPAPSAPLPTSRYWRTRGLPLDQGDTPQCVGFASRGWLNSGPVYNEGGPDSATIYHGAQLNDEWDGEDYDGTSARGAMKYLQSLGMVSAYVWARAVSEAERWVAFNGPLLLGLDWRDSFDEPASDGVLRLPPTASIRGGHEVLIVGVNTRRAMFRMMNSWGAGWAQHGRAWMPYELLDRLLSETADVVTPTEVLVP